MPADQKKSARGKQRETETARQERGQRGMNAVKQRDRNEGEGWRGKERRGGRRQGTCVQSRKVCSSPSSADRQTGPSGEFIFTSV